jgi:hypothetical protein
MPHLAGFYMPSHPVNRRADALRPYETVFFLHQGVLPNTGERLPDILRLLSSKSEFWDVQFLLLPKPSTLALGYEPGMTGAA